MGHIGDIFRAHGPEYIQRFGGAMPSEHRKVIEAIVKCRTGNCGVVVYECEGCGKPHTVFRSCGNRHCPTCQNHKTREWLGKQMKRQLPGHHFMVTFTVPEQLRRFIRSNQRICYAAMFKASSQTLKKLAADERHIGGDLPGFFGVLHTWGRQLQYHPHIHFIAPGGAISRADGKWHTSRTDFYMPVRAMSKIFKAKFRDEMKRAGVFADIPPIVWKLAWNVNCQAVGDSKRSVKYLAPYVFKVAVSDKRIVRVDGRRVFVRYKKTGSQRWRTMELDVMEFMRRFLQHVLPTGFMKVRYYGFLSPSSSIPFKETRAIVESYFGLEVEEHEPEEEILPPIICPHCGGGLKYFYSVLPYQIKPSDPG